MKGWSEQREGLVGIVRWVGRNSTKGWLEQHEGLVGQHEGLVGTARRVGHNNMAMDHY